LLTVPLVDVLRVADGVLVEHWDVIQDEATDGGIEDRQANVRRLASVVPATRMTARQLMGQRCVS
jgi:hypothetical protein